MYILALRSYGDYVILLNSIKHAGINKKMRLLVSDHLRPLHESLNSQYPNNFEFNFIDFGIKRGLLSFFTNRYFFSFNSIQEVVKIFKNIEKLKIKDQIIYLEHKARKNILSFFLRSKINHIYSKGNIYEAFAQFFDIDAATITFTLPEIISIRKVLIFPDSRKRDKIIDHKTMHLLTSELINQNIDFKIANFNHSISNEIDFNKQVTYKNFNDLVLYINECDLVISSDSVPAHIAEFLGKPHVILYNEKVNYNWLTPFAKKYKMYSTFEEATHFLNQYLGNKW
jgi:ADP-heptose:LPS heptosyltransferase